MSGCAPTLYVIAGANGAGKSTLYYDRIAPITHAPFVNADAIERCLAEAGPQEHEPYRASRRAAARRQELLAAGCSFVTETVFSHESKLELVRQAGALGYRVELFHVHVRDPAFSVARVALRAARGGHDVPKDKIRARYARGQPLIREAAGEADIAMIFDNSPAGVPPRWLFTLEHGHLAAASDQAMPQWARDLYL